MALYFVASGGSNTAPYDTWAKAATSFQTALTAASAAGDIVIIQHNAIPAGDKEVAADTTYTFANDISVISASNDGGSAYTPTVMGTANWIGNSTVNRSVTFAGAFAPYVYGVTIRISGATADSITLASTAGQKTTCEQCYLWQGSTVSTSNITAATTRCVVTLINCTFRFGQTGQRILPSPNLEIIGGSISSAGTIPLGLFGNQALSGGISIKVSGLDASAITGTLVPDTTGSVSPIVASFERCKFGAGVTVLAAQTSDHGTEVFVSDCSSGDTHGLFGYYNQFGSAVTDSSTKYTSGAAGQSWSITTTARCGESVPFITPWVSLYNSTLSAATYKLELLRNNGTASAYNNNQVWGEFSVKNNTGFTNASTVKDRSAYGGTAAAQTAGAGTGSWTIGASNSPASFIVDSGSITPAEVGYLRARVYVAIASISNLFLDPQIRT